MAANGPQRSTNTLRALDGVSVVFGLALCIASAIFMDNMRPVHAECKLRGSRREPFFNCETVTEFQMISAGLCICAAIVQMGLNIRFLRADSSKDRSMKIMSDLAVVFIVALAVGGISGPMGVFSIKTKEYPAWAEGQTTVSTSASKAHFFIACAFMDFFFSLFATWQSASDSSD